MGSDDEDAQIPKETSAQHDTDIIQSIVNDSTHFPPNELENTQNSSAAFSFLTERSQLEAARLARAQARRNASTNPTLSHNTSVSLVSSAGLNDPRMMAEELSDDDTTPLPDTTGLLSDSDSYLYPQGEIRQTASRSSNITGKTELLFKLSDVLGNTSELHFAVLSSFMVEPSWIYSLLPPSLPVLLITQPSANADSAPKYILPNWIRVSPSFPNGRGIMNAKFFLLFYKSGNLRIAITTADLCANEWENIANSVWIQDLPEREFPTPPYRTSDDFPSMLSHMLESLNVRSALKLLLQDNPTLPISHLEDLRSNWDFSKVRTHLVPSIAGKHEGWPSILSVGHTRLMRAVRQIGARADVKPPKGTLPSKGRELQLEYRATLTQSYSASWIDEFFLSAQGTSPDAWLSEGKVRRQRRLDSLFQKEGWAPWKSIKVHIPNIQDDAGNTKQTGTIPLVRTSRSGHENITTNSNMILATLASPIPEQQAVARVRSTNLTEKNDHERDTEWDDDVLGWVYVGSHPFTSDAWGRVSGTSFTPIIEIANYELGIILPITHLNQVKNLPFWQRRGQDRLL